MIKIKYVECKKCGTVHYVVNEQDAKLIKDADVLYQEFSNRNLKYCSSCGSSNQFLEVSEEATKDHSGGSNLPPILLSDK